MSFDAYEPTPDYLADTGQVKTIRESDLIAPWRRAVGLLSLLGAVVLTIATLVVILLPGNENASVPTNALGGAAIQQPPPQVIQDPVAVEEQPVQDVAIESFAGEPVDSVAILPTLAPESINSILSQQISLVSAETDIENVRNIYNPFTIVPERPRSEVITYTIVPGDTIFTIAERYGLQPETIVWGNDNSIVNGLRPGRVINILPVDGVYHQVLNAETIADIAGRYYVDPYSIIDSEYNDLFQYQQTDPLPNGTWVMIPGGQREQISWNPVVQRVEGGSGNGGGSSGGQISFAPGEPGSCGLVDNPGGTGWVSPLGNYSWIRGFSGVHSGVDLSASEGTPVQAANGGTVIYSGWSNWGYGYTIVLAHGPYTTLYGHLSAIYTRCGQYISPGSTIGAVGNSGNSTGPHLHFEVRYNDQPTDPTLILAF